MHAILESAWDLPGRTGGERCHARLPDVALSNGTMQKYKIRATDEIVLSLRRAIGG
jgi:hypothetical protein